MAVRPHHKACYLLRDGSVAFSDLRPTVPRRCSPREARPRAGSPSRYSFILGIIIVPQTGHGRFADRGGSSPGPRGLVAGAKDPGWNFLHFWHHHSNLAISP